MFHVELLVLQQRILSLLRPDAVNPRQGAPQHQTIHIPDTCGRQGVFGGCGHAQGGFAEGQHQDVVEVLGVQDQGRLAIAQFDADACVRKGEAIFWRLDERMNGRNGVGGESK